MILNSQWLKQYIPLPKDMESILKRLIFFGLEVESIQKREIDITFLRIAQIIESKSHPNADRLTLCTVQTKENTYRIVCGAKNFKDGDKAILALPGAELKDGLKIKENKIRGEVSQGMLCSEVELGLAEASEGILILPPETSLNDNMEKVLGLGQTIFELNITPNRPDCLSFLGVARELSAILGKPVQYPKIAFKEGKTKISQKVKVKLQDYKKCNRYMARFIEGVKVCPSPKWLRDALKSIGQRSINNIVDVTNFVLMEWGQPLHAFDFNTIEEGTVVVRSAKEGEIIVTLDGQKQSLSLDDLLICDSQKPLALAGIMGGSACEVSQTTTNILLESAYFDPKTIRKTSKRLGLSSESSKRFEKGVDMEGLKKALDRAAQLMAQVSGGTVAQGIIDCYPRKFTHRNAGLTVSRLKQYLGYSLSPTEIKNSLTSLGFRLKSFSKEKFIFKVPSYRVDINHEVDLIEDIARLRGYDKIPTQEHKGRFFLEQKIASASIETHVKTLLTGAGLTEVVNYSFCSPLDLKKIRWTKEVLRLQNPLGEEYSIMRPSLVPALLKNLFFNLSHQNDRIQIFELRPVFDEKGNQRKILAGLISGTRKSIQWDSKEQELDFYDLKAIAASFFEAMHLNCVFKKDESIPSYYHPLWASQILIRCEKVGFLGKIHPDVEEAFDLRKSAFVFEIEFDTLEKIVKELKVLYQPLPKFPAVKRDLSLLLSQDVSYEKVYQTIQKAGENLLKDIQLFDLYEKEPIPKGYKSFTFALIYQSLDRTLTDAEVTLLHDAICKALIQHCHAQIR